MSKEPIEYLKHILDECSYISSAISSDTNKEELISDETLKRAVFRSLEIIGKATKRIPTDFKLKWDSIKWKNMAGR